MVNLILRESWILLLLSRLCGLLSDLLCRYKVLPIKEFLSSAELLLLFFEILPFALILLMKRSGPDMLLLLRLKTIAAHTHKLGLVNKLESSLVLLLILFLFFLNNRSFYVLLEHLPLVSDVFLVKVEGIFKRYKVK